MNPERILVALQGSESDSGPIQAAAELAKLYRADLRGLFVEPDPAAYMLWTGPGAAGASVVSTALDAMREEADRASDSAKSHFEAEMAQSGLSDGASFRRICDSPSDSAQQARLVRLLVTCAKAASGKGQLADFTTACLVNEGCPVFVPRRGELPPRKIAFAWDGSKEAARAAFACEPLLASRPEVVILHSEKNLDYSDRAASAPNRLANWLNGRGLTPTHQQVSPSGRLGEAILEAASDCDLIVAGAYGHSRITQFVFGGVTRSLVSAQDAPSLLLAH